ncbi:MAG: FAD-dependent oxidoreductase [Clostridia bacterium]|nr:FAD-dependent oxidoreductase [Clostridia bacterium]
MNKYFPHLFSPLTVGRIHLKNRIAMSAMHTCYFRTDGTLSPKARAHYIERARGGVGLIVTEVASMEWPLGRGSKREPRWNDPTTLNEWADVVQTVHSFGTKIIGQLNHGGFIAPPEFNNGEQSVTAWAEGGESAVTSEYHQARTMTLEEIRHMVKMAGVCAANINDCGFDGIEFHAAHDYLFNEFLSPLTNKRDDDYGGSPENRARVLLECIREAKAALDPGKIISVKIPVCEELPGGMTMQDGIDLAWMCEQAGANLIDCSVGQGPDGNATEAEWMPDGRRLHFAAAVKPHVQSAKIAVVGKIRTPELAEKAIAEGMTDMVMIGRALLCDPNWAWKAETGRAEEIRPCLSCRYGCLHMVRTMTGMARCVLNPYQGYEDIATERHPGRAETPKNVLIVGAGIAGMQAAIVAKKRGHQVTLLEKSEDAGGQMKIAGVPPYKGVIHDAMNWFRAEVARLDIPVETGVEADLALIRERKPDAVILATGSRPSRPAIPGIEEAADGWEVLKSGDAMPSGKEVVLIGGGMVGCEIADALIARDCKVTILEMLPEIARGMDHVHKQRIQRVLREAGAQVFTGSCVQAIAGGRISYEDEAGMQEVSGDLVICATGQEPLYPEWEAELRQEGIEAYAIGDALATGDFCKATRSAMDVAMML